MDEPGLRPRLIAAGVDLVTTGGLAAVSLREIARAAGVSHGAPRRYFPTHLDLLAAVAAEGFAMLAARVSAVLAADPGPVVRVTALARAYVDFAATNRGMFELMFRHELLIGNGIGLREQSQSLFRVLVDLLAEAGVVDPARGAAALWANLHGLTQLHAWGSLGVALGDDDVEPLLQVVLAAYLR
jgi:AcrR family transcriptional regulator